MPLYTFENPDTGERKDIFFSMNDTKAYFENGVDWIRVFSKPNATISSNLDPYDSKAFVEKTRGMKGGTVGDLWDMSKELSEKRGGDNDPIRKQSLKEYADRRSGTTHPDDSSV